MCCFKKKMPIFVKRIKNNKTIKIKHYGKIHY